MNKIKIYEKLSQIAENKLVGSSNNPKLYWFLGYYEGEEDFVEDKLIKEKFKEWGRQVTEAWYLLEKIDLTVTLNFFLINITENISIQVHATLWKNIYKKLILAFL